jgi:hypothetical protein
MRYATGEVDAGTWRNGGLVAPAETDETTNGG